MSDSKPVGTSDAYLQLLRGEITAKEYVEQVKAEVHAEVQADFARRRESMKGTQRAYGKKHERKAIGREGRKSVRNLIRSLLP